MKARSDKLVAAGIAILALAILGFAVASRPVAPVASTPSAFDAHPAQAKGGGSGWRTAFL